MKSTNMEQAIISQHLSVLKKADLVITTAKQKERHYSVKGMELNNIIEFCVLISRQEKKTKPELKNAYPLIFETYQYLKTLLHGGRMSLIEIMSKQGNTNVNTLSELSKTSQSITSQNLKILLELELAIREEQGRAVYYKLNQERLQELRARLMSY